MDSNDKKRFTLDYSFYDSDFETYFNKDKTFGRFIDDGKAYLIENQDTPRQWLQYLCNDKIRSAVANDGKGFIWHCAKSSVTKQWEKTYLIRKLTWYTASVAWLIHGGYEEILGVKAGFDGLEINPHPPKEWKKYRVEKEYRGTRYIVDVVKSENESEIWVDGIKISGNIVNSEKEECNVKVFIK